MCIRDRDPTRRHHLRLPALRGSHGTALRASRSQRDPVGGPMAIRRHVSLPTRPGKLSYLAAGPADAQTRRLYSSPFGGPASGGPTDPAGSPTCPSTLIFPTPSRTFQLPPSLRPTALLAGCSTDQPRRGRLTPSSKAVTNPTAVHTTERTGALE